MRPGSPSGTLDRKISSVRAKFLPLLVLSVLVVVWATAMTVGSAWGLFERYGAIAVTMMFGSFVAGSTPAGGGAFAFPVLTKVLGIAPAEASLFGLMIQAIGMGMASLWIWARGYRIVRGIVPWAVLGGIVGQLAGAHFVPIAGPYPKLLFGALVGTFGFVLLRGGRDECERSTERLDRPDAATRGVFVLAGAVGGLIASKLGTGLDMVVFMVMTLAYAVPVKIGTPTSVVLMAINAWVGTLARVSAGETIGPVWSYWAVAVPVVAVGAPFGAWFAARVDRRVIVSLLSGLIALEIGTTAWLVPIDGDAVAFVTVSVAVALAAFAAMKAARRRMLRVEALAIRGAPSERRDRPGGS